MSTAGQRMAAATLATLGRRDRAWVLSKLPPNERDLLKRLLRAPAMVALASLEGGGAVVLEGADDDVPGSSMDHPNPILAATADRLGTAWAALWLSGAHPDLFDAYIETQPPARARALQVARDSMPAVPAGLAGALGRWVGKDAA